MYATFNTEHTVKLLEAAGGDFDRLRKAVDYIRRNKLVFVIQPTQVREALKQLEPEYSARD